MCWRRERCTLPDAGAGTHCRASLQMADSAWHKVMPAVQFQLSACAPCRFFFSSCDARLQVLFVVEQVHYDWPALDKHASTAFALGLSRETSRAAKPSTPSADSPIKGLRQRQRRSSEPAAPAAAQTLLVGAVQGKVSVQASRQLTGIRAFHALSERLLSAVLTIVGKMLLKAIVEDYQDWAAGRPRGTRRLSPDSADVASGGAEAAQAESPRVTREAIANA